MPPLWGVDSGHRVITDLRIGIGTVLQALYMAVCDSDTGKAKGNVTEEEVDRAT